MTVVNKIKKINDVRELIGDDAADAAISKAFKENAVEIKKVSADIAEAEIVLQDAKTEAVKYAMKALLECATYQKDMLKKERREAKEFIKNDKEEWTEESPIDIGTLFDVIFGS